VKIFDFGELKKKGGKNDKEVCVPFLKLGEFRGVVVASV